MANLIKWLRGLGPAGSFAATILVFLTTNWGAAVSVLTGLIVASWASAITFFQEPSVRIGIEIFLVILWTIVGVLYLYDRQKPRIVRIAPDYRYGLTFEGINPGLDPLNDATWLSFSVLIRNFSQAPIKYTVQGFDFRIGSRALPRPERTLTGYLPRGGGKAMTPSKFSKDDVREFFGRRVNGTAEIVITYGHPQQEPVRRLTISANIILHLPADGSQPAQLGQPIQLAAFGADIIREEDEPI